MANTVEELEAQRQAKEEELEANAGKAAEEAVQEGLEQGLSENEIKKLIQAARSEEKDKLYPQIQELKGLVKEQQEYIRAEKDRQEKAAQEDEDKKEARRLAKLSEEDRLAEKFNRLEEQLKQEREERQSLEAERTKEQRKRDLASYREAALRVAGDKIIPEMVYGDSETEIDNAIVKATQKYEELEQRLRSERGQKVKNSLSGSASPGMEALEEDELEGQIPSIDSDKYETSEDYRNKIKNQIALAYQRQSGM